jgi:hypothetical protein
VDHEPGSAGGVGGGGGGCGVKRDNSSAGGPGHGGGGSGVCRSLSAGRHNCGSGFADGGGGGSGGSGWGGTYSYGTKVCQYSFHMSRPSGLIIGRAVYGE